MVLLVPKNGVLHTMRGSSFPLSKEHYVLSDELLRLCSGEGI